MFYIITEDIFCKENIALNGSKFLLGNGYMGYRGTLEEFSKNELVSCVLSGVYDKVGNSWREPVNAPNVFHTRVLCNNEFVSCLTSNIIEHNQNLDIKNATHFRKSIFETNDGNRLEINAKRFLSADNINLMAMEYSVSSSQDCQIVIETGIDFDVWDMNGPHLKNINTSKQNDVIILETVTHELEHTIAIAEKISLDFGVHTIENRDNLILHKIIFDAKSGKTYSFVKYASVYTALDEVENPKECAINTTNEASKIGFEELLSRHAKVWEKRWNESEVVIEGDDEAWLAMKYSIYHLLAIAPTNNGKASIPARGLSGQVYKGGCFWDTEMFMLPFFAYTNPEMARNLLKYRHNTLEGAKRKAKEYGYKGAFFAWESQDSGDDACTLFNVTDVHTNRPIRTYFRDRQIHVSADVAHGIWQYYLITGDVSLLLDGGAEVILECARFYYSYSYFKKDKNRFELLQVVGPDEYHERVDNNVFTNIMVKNTLEITQSLLKLLEEKYPADYSELIEKLDFKEDICNINEMYELLYIPEPNNDNIIEQFDGYFKLEDISLDDLKKRIIIPNEYWGGSSGIATTTQILKQADVLMMLTVFKNQYSELVKKANWEYYEQRCENGSSLSHCAYAIVAADIGMTEWAYDYFMKTATIDLSGLSKQYLGSLYIGGTHPAANGGAWMTAILGFAGVYFNNDILHINPKMPSKWTGLCFKIKYRGNNISICISTSGIRLLLENNDNGNCTVNIKGDLIELKTGVEVLC